jgi:hypothetical protein
VFFAGTTLSLLVALAQGSVVYAPADLVAGIAVWLVEVVAVLLIFNGSSRRYYIKDPDLVVPNPDRRARSAAPLSSP